MDSDTVKQEDDQVVLERLLGMKQEWVNLEADIRKETVALQNELTNEKREKEDVSRQLLDARKECDELLAKLQKRDEEIKVSLYLKKYIFIHILHVFLIL